MNKTFAIHHKETLEAHPDISPPDAHQDLFSKTSLGFWIYLMTDCVLFATLFITYAVMHHGTAGGPTSRELFDLPTAFAETLILLCSTVACGFMMLSTLKNATKTALGWLLAAFVLGAAFVAIELTEFTGLVQEGHSWQRSAFLSAFFTLVGTHGAHVSVGLLWMLVMMVQLLRQGIIPETFRRLAVFSLFWHFLDLVWIFIFTFVYLMGVV
jgi:cytochrome o ubiquinol oxidase subunit III